MTEHMKIPLPKFITLLTGNNVPVQKAMAISGKIYKDCNTPAKLVDLSDVKLIALGIQNQDDRKAIIGAMQANGYLPRNTRKKRSDSSEGSRIPAGPSSPTKRKRKRCNDANPMLPESLGADELPPGYHTFDFTEIVNEEALKGRSTIINRAPIMTAWAMIVAERLGFQREEALSIASVYTEMNAIAKGISIGIHKHEEERDLEAVKGGSQPYVELMGRRIPLFRTQTEQWRALSKGSPIRPQVAFNYISRALRQTTPYIIGALRLLAESYTVEELNKVAWSLYTDFRPSTHECGGRSEVKCSTILNLKMQSASVRRHDTSRDMDEASPKKKAKADQDDEFPSVPIGSPLSTNTDEGDV